MFIHRDDKMNETSGLSLADASVNNITATLTAAANFIPSNAPGSFSSYVWSPGGATTSSIPVTATNNYTVTVTNTSNGCTATDAVLVTVNKTPPTAARRPRSGSGRSRRARVRSTRR